MRPAKIQDLKQLAAFDQRWAAALAPRSTKRWRNFAALALLALSLIVALKDLVLLAWVMLGFAPLYAIFGWFQWLGQHPPKADWTNYWVIECDGKLQACAKWEHFDSYSELQQVYVGPKWRFHGLAASLIDRCISQTRQPIYVISDRGHSRFFERFGFAPIAWEALPDNFPIAEFAIPGLERPRDAQVPMVFQPYASPELPPSVIARIGPTSDSRVQPWQGIPAKIYDRPSAE